MNQNEPHAGLTKLFGAPCGDVAQVLKLTQIEDVEAVRAFLRGLAGTPELQLVAGCHGGVVTEACNAWLMMVADRM